jgi:hypothetical protein
VLRTLPLLQHADEQFLRMAGCVSCHNNTQTAETIALARGRGLRVDDALAERQRAKIGQYVDDWRERGLQLQGVPGDSDTMAAILNGLAAERYAPDAATDAMVRFVRLQQAANGSWVVFAHRPPIEAGSTKVTVESIRALQAYGVGVERPLAAAAIARAASWLAQAQPEQLQDRAYVLLGLHDTGAENSAIAAAAARVTSMQRPDGGWAQIPSLGSDAYATGQAITALLESGARPPSDPAIRRGVQFLVRTQMKDGSWYVARRAIPIQPYFDAGFPHGRDQFISAAATNWAAQALIRAAISGS